MTTDVNSRKAKTSHTQQEKTNHQTHKRGKHINVLKEEEEIIDNTWWPESPPRRHI